ncbi:MAG: glycosyltransferase family 2 protein [Synergistaceae bacterium]|nr:glycosyltransferase family 2 protein [Synergistaceae bacterium]
MPEINILLASYNGEKFISQQIDSILAQNFQDFNIIIRDDGSQDNTPEIIEDYSRKYPDKIIIIHDNEICRHPTKNFFQLIKYASAKYIMFSDQDDYWLPDKVKITLDHMKICERENPGVPICVFTGLERVDADLKTLNQFMAINITKSDYDFKKLISGNCASGCTEMLNRELYSNLGEYDSNINLHDWWAVLYASACGVVSHVNKALIYYRIHTDNSIGGKEINIFKRLYLIINSPIRKFKQSKQFFYQDKARLLFFRERYSGQIKSENLNYLDEYLKIYSYNKLTRINAIIKTHYLSRFCAIEKIINLVKILLF